MPNIAKPLLLILCTLLFITACNRKPDTELTPDELSKKYGKVLAMQFHLNGDEIDEMVKNGRSEFGIKKTRMGNWQLQSMPLEATEAGRVLLHVKGHAKQDGAVALSFWTFWTDNGKVGPGLFEKDLKAGDTIDKLLVGEQVYMTSAGRVAPSLDLEKLENLQLESLDVYVLKGRNASEHNWVYFYFLPALVFAIFGFWLKRRN